MGRLWRADTKSFWIESKSDVVDEQWMILRLMKRMISGEFFEIICFECVEFTRKSMWLEKRLVIGYEMEIKVLLGKISIEFYEKGGNWFFDSSCLMMEAKTTFCKLK